MTDPWTNEQLDAVIGDWHPSAESFHNAVTLITAGLAGDDDGEQRKLLTLAVAPLVAGGVVPTFGTVAALVALVVRSVNTMAQLTNSDPVTLWQNMATELEAEIVSKLE